MIVSMNGWSLTAIGFGLERLSLGGATESSGSSPRWRQSRSSVNPVADASGHSTLGVASRFDLDRVHDRPELRAVFRRSRCVVRALDHESETIHVDDPEVPLVARPLGEDPGIPWAVDLALGEVSGSPTSTRVERRWRTPGTTDSLATRASKISGQALPRVLGARCSNLAANVRADARTPGW